MEFQNRISAYPARRKITVIEEHEAVGISPKYMIADVTYADEPTQEGTPITADTLNAISQDASEAKAAAAQMQAYAEEIRRMLADEEEITAEVGAGGYYDVDAEQATAAPAQNQMIDCGVHKMLAYPASACATFVAKTKVSNLQTDLSKDSAPSFGFRVATTGSRPVLYFLFYPATGEIAVRKADQTNGWQRVAVATFSHAWTGQFELKLVRHAIGTTYEYQVFVDETLALTYRSDAVATSLTVSFGTIGCLASFADWSINLNPFVRERVSALESKADAIAAQANQFETALTAIWTALSSLESRVSALENPTV